MFGADAVGAALFAVGAGVLIGRARARRRRFAPNTARRPSSTTAALERHRWLALRHSVIRGALDARLLEEVFDEIVSSFSPQQVDYSNTAYGKDHWNLSCFMQYTNGVAAGKVDLRAGERLMTVCAPILAACDDVFLRWYETLHPKRKTASRSLLRLQSFVTRYRPNPDETHLPRHIDGANIDGSLVLGLPSYAGFGGGGLTVWDGDGDREVFEYPDIGAGDACVLDARVWHQSNPVSSGERWVVVIFYQARPPTSAVISCTACTPARPRRPLDSLAGGRPPGRWDRAREGGRAPGGERGGEREGEARGRRAQPSGGGAIASRAAHHRGGATKGRNFGGLVRKCSGR